MLLREESEFCFQNGSIQNAASFIDMQYHAENKDKRPSLFLERFRMRQMNEIIWNVIFLCINLRIGRR
jgi:hypothetical protein